MKNAYQYYDYSSLYRKNQDLQTSAIKFTWIITQSNHCAQTGFEIAKPIKIVSKDWSQWNIYVLIENNTKLTAKMHNIPFDGINYQYCKRYLNGHKYQWISAANAATLNAKCKFCRHMKWSLLEEDKIMNTNILEYNERSVFIYV